MGDRVNSFGGLSDFKTRPAAERKPVDTQQIDKIANEVGFPSRHPVPSAVPKAAPPKAAPSPAPASAASKPAVAQRRYRTGRNLQLNIKVTADAYERFYKLADASGVPLGELFDRALTALEQSKSK